MVEDPATTLVRTKGHVFLALIRILAIEVPGAALQSIPLSKLADSNVTIVFQILSLKNRHAPKPVTPETGESEVQGIQPEVDWEWDTTYENKTSVVRTRGQFVSPIDPVVHARIQVAVNARLAAGFPVWQFKTEELRAVTAAHLDRAAKLLEELPTVPYTPTFPYRAKDGAHSELIVCFNFCSRTVFLITDRKIILRLHVSGRLGQGQFRRWEVCDVLDMFGQYTENGLEACRTQRLAYSFRHES